MQVTMDGLVLSGGSTAQALTATPAKLTAFASGPAVETAYGASQEGDLSVQPVAANNQLLLCTPGQYRVDVSAAILGAVAAVLTLQVYVNGAPVSGLLTAQTITNGGTNSISFHGVVSLTNPGGAEAPLSCEVWGSVSSNGSITPVDVTFTATRIG